MSLDDNDWAVKNRTRLESILEARTELFDYSKIKPPFSIDGKPYELTIELTDNAPIVQRAWRLAPEKEQLLDEYLNKLLKAGVIYPIDDSPYSATCVLVKKAGRANEYRCTTDFRRLNAKVKKYAYMSSTALEMFNQTCGAERFTVVDVHSAFFCMPVRKEDQFKLAFSTHRGMMTYKRMPQGFANSPSWLASGFAKMLMTPYTGRGPAHVVGRPCLHSICTQFVDDIAIYSDDEYHLDYVEFIFKLLEKHNLSLRADKCQIGRRSLEYLGVNLSADGLRVSPDKVKALHEAPRPRDVKGVKRLMGQLNFHRAWIKEFAHNSANITNLLRKGVKWEWDQRHDAEYDYLLKQLSSGTCLAQFSWERDTWLRVDGSSYGYGATLSQFHNGERKVCYYASKRLTETEAKRPARDLECAALDRPNFRPARAVRNCDTFACVTLLCCHTTVPLFSKLSKKWNKAP